MMLRLMVNKSGRQLRKRNRAIINKVGRLIAWVGNYLGALLHGQTFPSMDGGCLLGQLYCDNCDCRQRLHTSSLTLRLYVRFIHPTLFDFVKSFF